MTRLPTNAERDGLGITPGPWRTDATNSWNVWARDCKIADSFDPNQSPAYRQPSKEERVANARLIAAAPDMYQDGSDAADALDNLIDHWVTGEEITDADAKSAVEALLRFNRALAKVRGQS